LARGQYKFWPAMLVVAVHDVHSAVKLVDAARVAFELGADLFVISKAASSAAQSGVPEIEKMAFKENKRVLYVPDIPDILELISPDVHYMVVPKRLSETPLDISEVASALKEGKKVLISVSGGTVAFSLKELEYGKPVYLEGVDEVLPPAAVIAIVLYLLSERMRGG